MKRRIPKWEVTFIASVIAVAGGCTNDESAPTTSVRLSVEYQADWKLTDFVVEARNHAQPTEVTPEVVMLLPSDWDGETVDVHVTGLRDEERWAAGEVQVEIHRNEMVEAHVVLERIPCGAWCVEGSTACDHDGVMTCVRAEDGCMEWSATTACADDIPFCSHGTCADRCVDECSEGETRCAGNGGTQACGENDSDECLEWLPVVECAATEVCAGTECAAKCADACAKGSHRCLDNGVSVCGDGDGDGCTEWMAPTACPAKQSCSKGVCSPNCNDECDTTECVGQTYAQCGQYDFDGCMDLSPGVSCVPSDGCLVGQCNPVAGCSAIPKTCADAPATACVDDETLRTYSEAGQCSAGECTYAHTDDTCSGACVDDECEAPACSPEVEPVVAATAGTKGAIAVDANGALHVAYYDATGGDLRYAERSVAGVWSTVPVDQTGDVGDNPSIVVDSALTVSILYYDRTAGDLKLAQKPAAGTWVVTTVDSEGDVGLQSSLTLDKGKALHACYADTTNGALKRATQMGDTWTVAPIDVSPMVGTDCAIVVDEKNISHISYRDFANANLKYASIDKMMVKANPVDSAGDVGLDTSIVADNDNTVVAYYDATNANLKVASFGKENHSAWTIAAIDSTGDVGRGASIAWLGKTAVRIAYIDSTNAQLKYAKRSGTTWSSTPVTGTSGAREPVSLAIGATGYGHAVYYNATTSKLEYARLCP